MRLTVPKLKHDISLEEIKDANKKLKDLYTEDLAGFNRDKFVIETDCGREPLISVLDKQPLFQSTRWIQYNPVPIHFWHFAPPPPPIADILDNPPKPLPKPITMLKLTVLKCI